MNKKLKYRFKIYYNDGTSGFIGGSGAKPEFLKYDFDGMMPWEEYEKIYYNTEIKIPEILKLAKEMYSKNQKPFSKIEIVNTETGEVIDQVDC